MAGIPYVQGVETESSLSFSREYVSGASVLITYSSRDNQKSGEEKRVDFGRHVEQLNSEDFGQVLNYGMVDYAENAGAFAIKFCTESIEDVRDYVEDIDVLEVQDRHPNGIEFKDIRENLLE